jgi:hypothetical protein
MASRILPVLLGSPLRAWLVSAAVGALGPLLFVYGGLIGMVVVAWLAIAAWYGRWRLHAVSGMLSGFGAAWLVILLFMYQAARVDDLPLWLAIGIGALIVGIGLLVAGENKRGSRRPGHELGREDSISYFRDFGASAPGVREEDDVGRWGRGPER